MKILFLQDDFPPHAKGGAGIVAATLARELARQGNEITVITAVQDRAAVGSFQEDGMRIERIYSDYAQRWRAWRSLYNPATVPNVRRILAEIKPDVVHAHNVHYHLSYWTLRLARRAGAKVFLTAHDVMLFHYGKLVEFIDPKHPECKKKWDYKVSAWQQLKKYRFWYNPLRNMVIRHLLKNVDKVFAVSAALKTALTQNNIKNVKVIHNGIDTNAWDVVPVAVDAFVKKHGLAGKKIILFGGRISGLKGGGVMLEALCEIVKEEPNAVLLLLGNRDAYVDKLIARARELEIAEHIVSTGWLSGDELKAAYHAASIMVVPSVCFDSLPTVALEAMVCRKPVVGSCFGGIPEIVLNGSTGYVTNPYDMMVFVQKMRVLLADANIRTYFGNVGRARVEQAFSFDRWCTDTLSAYTESHD